MPLSRLGLERLGLGFGLEPEIKGLGLVSVFRKFWRVSVSVSSQSRTATSCLHHVLQSMPISIL